MSKINKTSKTHFKLKQKKKIPSLTKDQSKNKDYDNKKTNK